jgi:serralysin
MHDVGAAFENTLSPEEAWAIGDFWRAGDGLDTIARSSPGDVLIANAPVLSLIGGAGNETIEGQVLGPTNFYLLRGGDGADWVVGADLADDINGNQGDDAVSGGAGDDWVLGGQGDDFADGGLGADLINGNRGADTCVGGEGADTVRGGQADDLVGGGGGDDQLFGDAGSDTFEGGAGADVFHVGLREGRDVIDDFNNAAGDRIVVDGIAEYSAQQSGADIVVTLIYGSEVASHVTDVVVRNANLAAMSDGWISG